MQRKGQSALEYLMTYGWAILIIIIVGGVLYYYGVFSPGKLVGESKIGFSKVYLDNWGISNNGATLNMILENRAGKDINVTQIYIEGSSGINATSDSFTMSAGEKLSAWKNVDIAASDQVDSGVAYQYDIAIEYYYTDLDPSGATKFNSTGTISGTA